MIFLLLFPPLWAADPAACEYTKERDTFTGGAFPKDFIWSLATASYQIEGAWNKDQCYKNSKLYYSWTTNRGMKIQLPQKYKIKIYKNRPKINIFDQNRSLKF